jgi:hypothetical protein
MLEIIAVVAVVGVGILYAAYKKPEWFGIASKAVGENVEKAAWAVRDKVEDAGKK